MFYPFTRAGPCPPGARGGQCSTPLPWGAGCTTPRTDSWMWCPYWEHPTHHPVIAAILYHQCSSPSRLAPSPASLPSQVPEPPPVLNTGSAGTRCSEGARRTEDHSSASTYPYDGDQAATADSAVQALRVRMSCAPDPGTAATGSLLFSLSQGVRMGQTSCSCSSARGHFKPHKRHSTVQTTAWQEKSEERHAGSFRNPLPTLAL